MNKLIIIICMLTVTISACQSTPQSMSNEKQDVSANDRADSFFEKSFQESLAQSPMFQSYLGIKDNQDKWDDLSEEKAEENLEITRRQLKELRSTINPDLLDEQTLISYRLFEKNAEDEIDLYKWRYHDYPVNQMHGVQSQIPSFLINIHRVSDKQDAEDYISRLNGVTGLLSQVIANMKMRTEMKIVPPRFVFPYVISDSRNVIKGNPFEQSSEDSTLLADFKSKVNALKIEQTEKDDLIRRASKALENKVGPAFEEMIAYLQALEKTATTDDGAWKFPDGEAFYNAALRQTTTTNLTADEIHQIGLREVARIQNEMHSIMDQVGFKGSLKEFFKFTREDKQFYYPDTAEGRQAYLSKAKSIIETMESHLDQVFITKPKDCG